MSFDTRKTEARDAIARHLAAGQSKFSRDFGVVDTLPTRIGRRIVPSRLRFRLRLIATVVLRPRHRRKAQRLTQRGALRLHPGSQKVRKESWVNIDVAGFPVDLCWNLLRPLPFGDNTVDAIFHEHLLEHFGLEEAVAMASDWCRVLKPAGVLRIGVPDAGAYVAGYTDENDFLAAMRPEAPTRLLAISSLFYWPQHKTMYDFPTLELVLTAAGFAEIEHSAFGDSRIAPAPDSPHRRAETLYVEAVKTTNG